MYITKDKIQPILNEYLQKVLMPKSPSSTQTFITGIAVGYGIRKANALLNDPKILETLKIMNVADDKGRINIDELYKIANDSIRMSGPINMPIINYNVDSSDFKSIYDIAKQHITAGEANGTDGNMQRSTF